MRCSLLLYSSLTPLPGQWDRRQSCKYTLGATFVIISQNFLIARHKSFGRATIARHNIKHVLWRAIAAHVALCSRPGLSLFVMSEGHKRKSGSITLHELSIFGVFPYSARIRENTDQKNYEYGHAVLKVAFTGFNSLHATCLP